MLTCEPPLLLVRSKHVGKQRIVGSVVAAVFGRLPRISCAPPEHSPVARRTVKGRGGSATDPARGCSCRSGRDPFAKRYARLTARRFGRESRWFTRVAPDWVKSHPHDPRCGRESGCRYRCIPAWLLWGGDQPSRLRSAH